MVHDLFGVSDIMLWETMQIDLPPLGGIRIPVRYCTLKARRSEAGGRLCGESLLFFSLFVPFVVKYAIHSSRSLR